MANFFFSSRRRHTRWPRDWSSDVCSSDLEVVQLFSESQSRFLITVKEENREQFEERFPDTSFIGKVTEDGIFSVTANEKPIIQEEIVNLQSIWESTFEKLFTDRSEERRVG